MKQYTLFLILIFTITSIYAQTKLIKASAYLDVKSGKLIQPANLLIENGLIKSINPKSIPESIEVIDLGSQILLPGLMDMHVHLNMDFVPNHFTLFVIDNASKSALRAAKNAESTLMAGFTTVRNIGQLHPSIELIDVALAEASDNGWINAPHIIPTGHALGITGGHADLSMQGGFAETVIDLGPEYGIADGTDEFVKAARYQIKHGAKAIKIMATAGMSSLEGPSGAQQMTKEEITAVVEEANRHHITVAAHAHGSDGIVAALQAGVTSIEHGSLLSDEAIKLFIQKGAYLVPTNALLDIIPLSYDKMNPIVVEKSKNNLPLAIKSHEKAIKAGVKIAMGTDAPLVPHGKNALELSAMMKRGMKSFDAIRAATIHSAEMLKIDDRGEIKEGLLADIIAVETNPLEDIKTLENVTFVMKGGTVYKNEK
ncbi:metal-dependent hydrolase family protein [Pareuzebyella sediminis]|uniref:metal-dependent hydrolase family protein n=1 Tax=Pareuzebyella sediminis TaxID=2607998 RepID=UPI0011ED6DB5|nr:amidohydrolase family protein [Pareuzebyella sediminis]